MTEKKYFEMSAAWPARSYDVADISFRLGEQFLSRIADTEKGSVRDSFRASATSLALWLADNWWRLRWETLRSSQSVSSDWRIRHELNSASGGALWPPVMIYSSSDRVVFAPSFGRNTVGGPQQYFDFRVATVGAEEYEAEIDRFIDAVIGHCAQEMDGKALAEIFRQVKAERIDPELAGWRRLEACLGFDPDQAPDTVIDALVAFEETVGEDGVDEAANAYPGAQSPSVLRDVIEATRASNVELDLRLSHSVDFSIDFPSTASPWMLAEAAAENLREKIGIRRGPLKRQEFADIFRARWDDLKAATATARNLPYCARLSVKSDSSLLSLKTFSAHDRRFELARFLGDAVWCDVGSFGIISHAKTDRQKFQRAFAHNLLCPFDDIRQHIDLNNPTDEDIDATARKFHVHSTVVRNQLIYKGYLPFENTREEAETV